MKYFRLLDDVHIVGRWHLGEVVEETVKSPLELWTGTPAAAGISIEAEITHPGTALDFCLTSFAVPVAITRLAEAIAGVAGGDLQRIPLKVGAHKGFEVLNSVRVIRCLDEGRSSFTKWTAKDHRADLAGKYRMVSHLRVNLNTVPRDAHFFRIEGWEIALIVSELIRSAMESCKCLGAIFQDVV